MLTTNLLPPSAQKAVFLEETRRIVRFFAGGIMVVIAVGLVLLVPPYFLNVAVRQELERSLALEEDASTKAGVDDLTARMAATNNAIDSLKKNVSGSSLASRISDEIFSSAGPEIGIQQLTVRSNGDITMHGFAVTRSDLLGFEKKLRESEHIKDVSSPLRNIIKETDIEFDIQCRWEAASNP